MNYYRLRWGGQPRPLSLRGLCWRASLRVSDEVFFHPALVAHDVNAVRGAADSAGCQAAAFPGNGRPKSDCPTKKPERE